MSTGRGTAAARARGGRAEGGVHVVGGDDGFPQDGTIVDEATPVSMADMIGHYKRSKFLAEQEAIAAARAGQHVMILNPTTPIGASDAKPTPTGRILVDFLNRNFPAYVDTGLNLVDVAEVARMHVVALERGTPGERYILGGENLTLKQILDRLSAMTGLPSPTMKVPHAVAMAFAFFDENITGKLRGKEPRATVEAVTMGRKMMFASSAKAERELGFKVLPVYPAMRAAVEWFLAHGYAPPLPEMQRHASDCGNSPRCRGKWRGWWVRYGRSRGYGGLESYSLPLAAGRGRRARGWEPSG